MIKLTQSAEEHLRKILSSETGDHNKTLRLSVKKGGCAGMEYQMKVSEPNSTDTIISLKDVKISLDAESIQFLEGSILDYTDDLNDSGFKINNPNATRSCGCGTSFEPNNNKS